MQFDITNKKKFFITTSFQTNDVIINNLALPLANVPKHVREYVFQSHSIRTTMNLLVGVKVLKG